MGNSKNRKRGEKKKMIAKWDMKKFIKQEKKFNKIMKVLNEGLTPCCRENYLLTEDCEKAYCEKCDKRYDVNLLRRKEFQFFEKRRKV